MRILFDHNTPAPLRHVLAEHQVETAYELGWAEITNGELLAAAEANRFDAMVTTDQSIRYQQNLVGRTLALIVISTNDWTRIRNWKSLVTEAVSKAEPGAYIEVEIPAG